MACSMPVIRIWPKIILHRSCSAQESQSLRVLPQSDNAHSNPTPACDLVCWLSSILQKLLSHIFTMLSCPRWSCPCSQLGSRLLCGQPGSSLSDKHMGDIIPCQQCRSKLSSNSRSVWGPQTQGWLSDVRRLASQVGIPDIVALELDDSAEGCEGGGWGRGSGQGRRWGEVEQAGRLA